MYYATAQKFISLIRRKKNQEIFLNQRNFSSTVMHTFFDSKKFFLNQRNFYLGLFIVLRIIDRDMKNC